MRQKLWLRSAPVYIVLCSVLFAVFYGEAKGNAVRALNEEQFLHARQAAQGIEQYFTGWQRTLGSLALTEPIIDLDEDGREFMALFQRSHADQIRAITRVSAAGRILHTEPPNPQAVGSDISHQKHMREILRDHRPVTSDVFRAVQGYDAIALHVPVFKNGVFAGTLAVVVNFQALAERYFAVIDQDRRQRPRLGAQQGRHAAVQPRDGGNREQCAREIFRGAPGLLRIVEDMLRKGRGATSYPAPALEATRGASGRDFTVYQPIEVGSTFWSIAVTAPAGEALSSLVAFRNRLILIMVLLLAGGVFFTYLGAKAAIIIREERKRRIVEEALRESEERFGTCADSLPQTVFEADRGGKVLYVNRAGRETFGYTDADFASGVTLFDLLAPEDRGRARANLEKRLQGEIEAQEYLARRRDGTTLPVITHTSPIVRAGLVQGIRGLVVDISERKRAESALGLGGAVSLDHRACLRGDPRGRRRDERAALRQPRDRADARLHARRVADDEGGADFTPRRRCRRSWRSSPGHETAGSSTRSCPAGAGTARCSWRAFIRATPLSFDGRDCIAGFFTDISERRQLEEERLKSAKLEAVGILAGGVAHDFNNLLQVIFGWIALAKTNLDRDAAAHRMLEKVEGALRQSVGLTTQLLTFAKGGKPLKRILDLRPVLEEVARFSLSGSQLGCRLDIAAGLRRVEVDEGQIAQVVQNIILNAVQATPEGGEVLITARNIQAPAPDLPAQLVPGCSVAVSVEDRGVGIPAENLGRIFDPYFTTKPQGSGLGLATSYSYSIIRNHGGTITVESELGKGSRFTFYLPAAGAGAGEDAGVPAAAGRPRSARILVMDDEDVVRTVTAEMLRGSARRSSSARMARKPSRCSRPRGRRAHPLPSSSSTSRSGGGSAARPRSLRSRRSTPR